MNSLAQLNPTLSAQWHPTKNGTLTPNDVTCGSNKKVWWQCEKGHEWQSWVADRNAGRGCPYCSGRFARLDDNLQIRNPTLCEEWHPTKNAGRRPSDYTFSSGKKVWWRCKRGHEWEASIAHRNNGRSCPFCNSQTSSTELQLFSELMMLFPDTMHRHKIKGVECDIYIPGIRVAIEVDGLYWHKDKEETDVRKLETLSKANVLLIRLREKGLSIPRELDLPYTRSDYGFPLVERVLSTIAKHVSGPSVRAVHQLYLKKGCLINELGFRKLLNMLPGPLPGMSLSEKFPDLAAEWHPQKNSELTPTDIASSSNLKVWWQCEKGHAWAASPNTRTRKGRRTTNCPYCSNRRFDKHGWHTSLAGASPVLAAEWHTEKNGSLSAADVPPNYSKKVWWRCRNGHEWQTTPNQRSNRKCGCPFCAGQRATLETCLQTKNPELAAEWHPTLNSPLTPTEVTIGSGRKVWWQCSRGHEWQAVVGERVKGTGCPFCAGHR